MRLLILGATGGIGKHLLSIGLERGHTLTAYVRSPDKITQRHERLRVIRGDVFNVDTLAQAIKGHDAVLSAFGVDNIRATTLRRDFGRTLAAAMTQSGVERVHVVSAAFLFRKIGVLGALLKLTLFRNMIPDMAGMEDEIKRDSLQWTIVRPPRLTNGPLTTTYRVADGALPPSRYTVSRGDVADFMIKDAEAPAHIREIVGIAH